jgi:hypothetical protein
MPRATHTSRWSCAKATNGSQSQIGRAKCVSGASTAVALRFTRLRKSSLFLTPARGKSQSATQVLKGIGASATAAIRNTRPRSCAASTVSAVMSSAPAVVTTFVRRVTST